MSTLDDNHEFRIAVLLPTRGRTTELLLSINSLFVRAADPKSIQLLISFDRDDKIGPAYFCEHIEPMLNERGIKYTVVLTERFGYAKLNYYYNLLGKMADADWLFIWNDDATMDTQGWDSIIRSHTGQFFILSVLTHNEHPYSIFPIVPSIWIKLLGRFSRHLEIDSEISQIAYILDIFKRVPIYCTHYRPDLENKEPDATFIDKIQNIPANDPNDPRCIRHPSYLEKRSQDINLLVNYMKHIGADLTWWESIINGQNPSPFRKMKENDTYNQVVIGPT